jgi:hypothetical protein
MFRQFASWELAAAAVIYLQPEPLPTERLRNPRWFVCKQVWST